MILYRTMTNYELINRLNGKNNSDNIATIKGVNTFKYESNQEYIHFFKYVEHAFYYMKENRNYIIVAQCIIPDELVSEIGFGMYGGVEIYNNNGLSSYYIPLPEYRIKKEDFKNEYINAFATTLYTTMSTNEINKIQELPLFDLEKEEGIICYRHYSYANMYYEMLCTLANIYSYNFDKIIKYLKEKDFNKLIEDYYQENKEILIERLNKKEMEVQRNKPKIKILNLLKRYN